MWLEELMCPISVLQNVLLLLGAKKWRAKVEKDEINRTGCLWSLIGYFFYGLEDTAQFALNDKITQLWKEVGLLNIASSAE